MELKRLGVVSFSKLVLKSAYNNQRYSLEDSFTFYYPRRISETEQALECYLILHGNSKHEVELGESAYGNMMRLDNVLDGLERKVNYLENKLSEYNKNIEDARAEFQKPFKFANELQDKLKRQFKLNALLYIDKKDEVIADDAMDRNAESCKEQETEEEEVEEMVG